jgi:anthranilate synthase component 1
VSDTFSCRLERVPDLPGIAGHLLRAGNASLCLDANGTVSGYGTKGDFLDRLGGWYRDEETVNRSNSDLPFCGGWFVYLGYELAAEIEPILELPASEDGLPVALAVRCDAAVIIEHGDIDKAYLVAEREEVLDLMLHEIESAGKSQTRPSPTVELLEPDPGDAFTDAVQRIHCYLEEGDVFQVNLSRAWHGTFAEAVDPVEIYRRLRRSNPAPFAGLMNWQGKSLMSSSPERLVEVRGKLVQTRPIAGTYPRGKDRDSDEALRRDMLAHPKERAEHIMLIDLERNDLGRVCKTGSIEVDELMVVESYAHVHHIVSNVRGTLNDDATPADVIRAVFPGGTITGCPKVRCMQIIAELERAGRGFYTGSMGYISRDGQMDINILIRSMLLDGNRVSLRTGAGIVADSQADQELAETVAKAKGLLLALEERDD